LVSVVADLAKAVPPGAIRWTRQEQIHLTLHFLGTIEAGRISEIETTLNEACRGHCVHIVRVAGLGCFPNPSRAKVIWAGLAGDLRAIQSLKESIDTHLAACGCPGEERSFQPHLTIGRVSNLNAAGRKAVAKALTEERDCDCGEWRIERVDLMHSALSRQGAAYRTVHSIELGKL
jgi:2'-5' RNA ligase